MPGLSQLKKFSSDLLSLGDELTVRASRGEKPVKFDIPKTVEDVNDSEDFVLGMPQIEAEVKNDTIDEDLSDLSGLINPSATTSNSENEDDGTSAFAAPDMSALLNPIAVNDDSQGDMPDLSMFEEQPVEEEIVEEEPEEVSIADMGLDALLAGAGFDDPEPEEEPEPEPEPDLGDLPVEDITDPLSDLGIPELNDLNLETPSAPETPVEDFGDIDIPSMDDLTGGDEEPADLPETDGGLDDFTMPSMDDLTGGLDLEEPATTEEVTDFAEEETPLEDFSDIDIPSEAVDFSADENIPEYEEDSLDSEDGDDLQTEESPEIDGLDFDIPDTDAQLNGSGDDSFELGSDDEFAMEGEFEIPGYSDVATAKEDKHVSTPLVKSDKGKKGKGKNLPEPDFSNALESEDLPPNTLSDAQYKQFLKNLGEYPLNVRLAFEDLIVQDEFTDDAEFEIIEKILNKAPARQVASMLEKMLDTSIPVPRDFEHRTAEEYEAYKKSLSYQLKNKIIPGILVGVVMVFVAYGIFQFSKNCIYKPLKANSLYKQGYALLQADEYPQSEMKFNEAVKKRLNKKWFFKYARGYREHKQYQRAGKMYQNILYSFRHDKTAGLEYADMELNDLANYERAEEIVRREVLDYHINDADGILMLGDVFLEWGTEKDPAKLELAREQYATLIQLYKANDLYLSRMMRYFIRTDNLRQVISSQKTFEKKKEKSLSSEDWTELSGYLLDKYYGPLAPSDEYLRYEIEGLRNLLLTAVKTGPSNPIALYNLSKYLIKTGETNAIENTLRSAIEKFNTVPTMKNRDIYKYIDSYRLLGEYYIDTTDYLQAQEQFAEGISLFTIERDNAGFEGNASIGKLYEDMGNIKYTISGDYEEALKNYKYSIELENDNPSIRYRIGYIQYNNSNYGEALGSFMKAGDGNVKERNLLLAMANTLSMRGDDYAAQGYYDQLLDTLDLQIAEQGMVFPQTNIKDYDVVNTYLSASNNYGVTLYKLAKRTGNSALNAQAIVQFSQSVRAWDALTRNQNTMVRLGGSNLAEMNIQYITHPIPEFEPSIYTEISKTLNDNEHL